jgi:alkylated DNA repair dioxygenase AlkB
MDLFQEKGPRQILPRDGHADYYGPIMPPSEADGFFAALMQEVDWQHDRLKLYGKEIVTRRKVAWHGDAAYLYTYSHSTKTALPWTPSLAQIKAEVEAASGDSYNCCLLNLYHSGEEGMAWHADDEKELQPEGAIASVSLGPERRFIFRHRGDKEKCEIRLAHGSLLVMRGVTQSHWEHSLPVMKRVTAPRINLTFRTIIG